MSLRLQIENVTTLPDGGPLGITVAGRRGIDIGRDQHLDWTLPDATRFISGKHCEVRYHDDAYWLHDVSTNGTFLDGSDDPLRGPHRLRTGDRLEIGPYIVAVTVEAEAGAPPPASFGRAAGGAPADLWHVDDVAPPVAPERGRPAMAPRPPAPDPFLDAPFEPYRPVREAQPAAPAEPSWGGALAGIWDDDPAPRPIPAAPSEPTPLPSPAPLPASAPQAPRPADAAAGEAELIRAFARGAELPEAVFARYSATELATLMGQLVRMSADNLKGLLAARAELKDLIRSSQTAVAREDNNPLKLAPTLDEALGLMFAPASASYLDAPAAFREGFRDIRHHQVQTFSAMQVAVSAIGRDLDPAAVEAQVEPDRGLGAVMGSRKARLWDTYVTGWKARTARHEDGLLGVFLDYFSEHYGRSSGRRTS